MESTKSAEVRRAKRILFLVQIPPPVHGASLRNHSLVLSKLLHENFDIRVLPLRFVTEVEEIGNVAPIKFLRLIGFLANLLKGLIIARPQLVYFTLSPVGNAFYRDVLIVLLVKLFHIPIVYHLRGLGIREARQKRLNKWLYDFVFKKTYVICLSNRHKFDIEGIPFINEVFVVPNGIKIEVSLDGVSTHTDVPEVLFLTNFIKTKGVYEFLGAISMVHANGVKFKARMVGAPGNVTRNDLVEESKRMKLTEILTIDGPLFGKSKFDAILQCDVFVLPTYYELFPGVILEAMQCGKPVVTTKTGAIPEIIDDGVNGLLVDTRDITGLAEKIELLLVNASLRQSLGDAARKKFLQNYTLEEFELRMKETFDRVLESSSIN